jgi:hypothetical protein
VSAPEREAAREKEQKSVRNRQDTGHLIKEETTNIKEAFSIGCFMRTSS